MAPGSWREALLVAGVAASWLQAGTSRGTLTLCVISDLPIASRENSADRWQPWATLSNPEQPPGCSPNSYVMDLQAGVVLGQSAQRRIQLRVSERVWSVGRVADPKLLPFSAWASRESVQHGVLAAHTGFRPASPERVELEAIQRHRITVADAAPANAHSAAFT
ncbi:hypothetical protein BKA56DRAFT_617558 [Ilyonectria sp. MPI-CAGE-AT-0026]|nr:hypothetical protein BKA56DRAFT_617558 [Ilyonectria sp. MPI-CAGE-AT-0026]